MKVPFSPDKKFSLAVVLENNIHSPEQKRFFTVYIKGSPEVIHINYILKILLGICNAIQIGKTV